MAKDKTVEKIKVWERGQITIPTKIRDQFGIEENTILTIKPLKDGIFLAPEKLTISDIQKIGAQMLRKKGLTVQDLLDQLDEDEE